MPSSPWPSIRRLFRRPLRRVGTASVGVMALLLTAAVAPSAAATDSIPDVDEVSTSDNVTHLANVPKQPPFDGQGAFGSDLAFTGDYAIAGNYKGFVIYDIADPANPRIVSQVLCQGGQGDVSVSGDLLYYSVDYPRESAECGSPSATPADADVFEGIRVFDISDKENPRYVRAVRTDCGSHTHTLVPGDGGTDYVYVSSYSPSEEFPDCEPPHDKISIIEVPTDDPASAEVVSEPTLFPDGGNHDQEGLLLPTQGCHDITAYPERDIAAGACMGDGVLMDISDPAAPKVIERVRDENFAFWHSATFTNKGTAVIFTDELGGGGAPTCNEDVGPTHGADAVYTLDGKVNADGDGQGDGVTPELEFEGYFKIDRHQADTENCVAHNGSLIPVPGKDYFVQAWYQGGVSVIDVNDPGDPEEIAYFERGPLSDSELVLGGSWSAYWYNGKIYSSDIQKGLDVLEVNDRRLRPADNVTYEEFNPQSQLRYTPGDG